MHYIKESFEYYYHDKVLLFLMPSLWFLLFSVPKINTPLKLLLKFYLKLQLLHTYILSSVALKQLLLEHKQKDKHHSLG